MYSNQELAEIHFMYGKADGNAALARRLYQERYPQRQCPDRKTFVRLHYRLCEYGKFNSPGLGRGRSRSTTPEVQEEILEAVNMTPSISTRRVALQVNVPHTTVWRLLKEYQLYPYHLQRVQALSPADYPARVRFCQWFLQQCGVNPNLILFTDEAQFTRDGITNFHNQRVWAYENPRATVPSHHQVRFSLNMWAGIIGDRLVGPHVLVNRFTGQAYTNFLKNTIPHVLEDTPLINRQHIHFLYDGAPAHFSRTARRYLDRRFPDRWIGRSGPIPWPPRSPDLNPLDLYLWGHLKSLVYLSPVPDLESLRKRIVALDKAPARKAGNPGSRPGAEENLSPRYRFTDRTSHSAGAGIGTYDFENQHIQHRLFIPKVEILAQYEASGRILLLPLFGKGDMNITLDNAHITYDEDYTLDVIDGRRHIRPKNSQAVAVPSRVYFQLDNLFNGDKFLSYNLSIFEELDISQKINKYTRAMGIINSVMKPTLVQKHTRIRLYNTLTRPMLSYGSEAWTLRKADKCRITACEMRFMRRTAGYTKWDLKRNCEILKELKTQPVLDYIVQNQSTVFALRVGAESR
ncbi:hypothetical protein ANN_10266 [Periplaneta americana]|uniref:DUF4817 domain-containing protein n=1 Tax=Periplaneta americana TaxID=6978 RepID=A0ABQ8TQE9_PERAM|nr:hypothetical protein ANN_10266 [Periplaneta americana]